MRRGKLDLVRNNTSARYSSPTNTGVKNPLRLPLVTNKERGSLSSPPTAVSNKRRLRSKKPHSQSPSSQPVIKIFLILALVFVFALKPASASWANSSFDRCMNITITSVTSETLTNFPAYINLTYDSNMLADFKDIRFYNASCSNDGTLIDYEIENYTTSTRAHIWTRIPSLPSIGTTISVYYKNNTAITSGENSTGVWNSNYVGVWHMEEGSGDYTDSTTNNYSFSNAGGATYDGVGILGNLAPVFNTSNSSYFTAGDRAVHEVPVNITVEMWGKRLGNGTNGYGSPLNKDGGYSNGYRLIQQNNKIMWWQTANGSSGNNTGSTSGMPDNEWVYYTALYNGTEKPLYINGKYNATSYKSINITYGSGSLEIGRGQGGGSYNYNGSVDELRISNVIRSAGWLNQTYQIIVNQASFVSFSDEEVGPESWVNTELDKCKNITITNPTTETLTNFPAYINLTYDSDMQPDFVDLRFYDSGCSNGGSLLDYEIENYTTSTNAHIWTRIPSLPTTGTTISVYYKNNTATTSGENASGVWDSNYVGVWHMTSVNPKDSTINGNNGTQTTTVTFNSSGKIDGDVEFDGYGDYIDCGNNSVLNPTTKLTMEAWIKVKSNANPSTYPRVIEKNGQGYDTYSIIQEANSRSFSPSITTINGEVWGTFSNNQNLSLNTWYYLAATYNNISLDSFKDGKLNHTMAVNGTLNTTSSNLIIGGIYESYELNGTIDEVRISNINRSASWINMSYLIVANQSNYVSFGDEEGYNSPPTHTTPGIVSTSGNNLTTDNITCYNQSTNDEDGDSVTNIYNWYKDGTSITALNMPFDTNTVSTASGAVKDYSGHGNNGTLGNGTSSKVPAWNSSNDCISGGCYNFDGVDDIIIIANDSSINNIFAGGGTIAAWIYPRSAGENNYGRIVDKASGGNGEDGYGIEMSGGNNVRLERGFSISRGVWYPSSSSINYSQWQHIAVTYNEDDISNDPVIYINGVAQSLTEQEDPNGTASSDAAQKIAIGNRVESSSFDGLIDEVIIYNDALTAEQVYQLYLEGINNHTNSTITASETTIGETWTCSVTPNDATEDGTTLNNTLTITDNSAPYINFTDPTPTNGASQTETAVYVNVTTSDDHNHSAFIDWNRSLVGWWSFESYNTTGIYDNSTYNNFGNFSGGLSTSNITTGKYGNALSFDGTDDYLDAGDIAAIDAATQLSACAWVKHNSITSDDTMGGKWDTTIGFVLLRDDVGANSGRTDTYTFTADGGAPYAQLEGATNASVAGVWTHVCGTYISGSATGLRLYINGVEDPNSPVSTTSIGSIDSGSTPLEIGAVSSTRYFDGTIDEVRLYNRALSPEEINASFNAGSYRLFRNFTDLSLGTYEYKAYAIDEAGNVNSTETRNITISTTTMNITLNLDPNPVLVSRNVSIYGHLNDSDGNNITNNPINIYINNSLINITAQNTWPSWLNLSWRYRTKINITSDVTTSLNNTIVLVNLSTSGLIATGKMNSDCGDTRFTDSNGNELQYTLETSTCNTTNTIYWTWINLTGSANTTVYAYYGNSAATIPTSHTNPDAGLVLYYHFDNSTAYGENSTLIYDFSKNGVNGTCSGENCPNYTTGKFGKGMVFDGQDDYINASYSSAIPETGPYTLIAWFNGDGIPNYGAIISRWNEDGYKFAFEMQVTENSLGCAARNASNSVYGATVNQGYETNSNKWIFGACTMDSGSSIYAYRYGVAHANRTAGTYSGWSATATGARTSIGLRWNGSSIVPGFNFSGIIDEVRIYNRTLTEDEINAIYNATRKNYISNDSLLSTDANGNYNYTITTPSTAGTYEIKVNTSYAGVTAEDTENLTVSPEYMNISLNLTPSSVLVSRNVSISGHVNISNETNVTNNTVSIYLNNTQYYYNNNTALLENTTTWWNTSYAYRTKINITSTVSTNLNNTIVLVNLSTSDLINQNKMRTDCGDTRFVDSNGNELQYTTETSTCNTTNTIYWAWINLTGNANNTVYAYYGNSAATIPTSYNNPDDGLVLYYHFDNSSAYGENNTRINDFSNKWNDGNCSSCPTWNSTGRYGGAYEYHGNSTSEFFDTGADISWSNTSNYSIGFWMKPRIVTINHGILGKTSTEWRTRLSSAGTFRFTLWNTTSNGGVILETTNIPANSWTHIFITYNGATGTGTLYRNGTQITTTSTQGEARDNSDNVYIGAAYNTADSGTWYFNGSIDEVRIYNRTLSADEIQAHYNSTRPNYINNHSLPRTDDYGNYNYTYTTPSTTGTYTIKVNTTYNGMSAEANTTLNVTQNYINISLNLNPNSTLTLRNISITGHVNESDGTNVTDNTVLIYINNTMYYYNNQTALLENTTAWWNTSYAYRTKINITSEVATNLNNTITLVNLSTSDLISQGKMNSDCGDTRFTDSNNNELQYTTETSTCNTNNTIHLIWTNLTGNANNTIYAYYGNSAANLPTSYTNPDTALVLYYHFDNSSAYGENSTKTYDFSKNGNNGTIIGSLNWSLEGGRFGGAYRFNASENYINTNFNIPNETGSRTVMAWVKIRGKVYNTTAKLIIRNSDLTGTAGTDYGISWVYRYDDFLAYVINGSGTRISTDPIILDNPENDVWYHLVLTHNNSVVLTYVNGALTSTTTCIGSRKNSNGLKFGLYDTGYPGTTFNGSIDEVRIYNRTLSADEILAIYNSTRPNYINNNSLPRTDDNGNYNYTYTPTQPGNYTIKANTTYNGMSAEATQTLTVTGTGWANSSFDRCKNITITNPTAETLTDFPAYINLSWDDDMLADFKDIRFYGEACNNGGSLLDYEIENYTTSTNAHIWTRIPSLLTTGTTISVYYKNNTAATSGENPTGVWNSNYKAVWHMKEVSGIRYDSTSNRNNLTENGTTGSGAGMIAGAADFEADNNESLYATDADLTSMEFDGDYTVNFWLNHETESDNMGIIAKSLWGCPGFGISWGWPDDAYYLMAYHRNSSCDYVSQRSSFNHTTVNEGSWYMMTVTFNDTADQVIFCKNAVCDAPDTMNITSTGNSEQLTVGVFWNPSGEYLDGMLDELRVSNTPRSPAWINMSYLIVANQSSYVSLGREITYISSCQELTSANTTYYLSQSVNSSGTCFNIKADNITLDCQGYTINYSQGAVGYGVNSTSYNFTVVKNCNIVKGSRTAYQYSYGILFYYSDNGTIYNNTVYNNGTWDGRDSHCVYLVSSENNNISNNVLNATTRSTEALYLFQSWSNIIANNRIEANGDYDWPLYAWDADYSNFTNNTIISADSLGGLKYGSAVYMAVTQYSNWVNNTLNSTKSQGFTFTSASPDSNCNNSIDESNLADGLPINYTYNIANTTISNQQFLNKGQVICCNCVNVTYSNITVTGKDGFSLIYGNRSVINNSNIASDTGLGLFFIGGTYNTVVNSIVNSTDHSAIKSSDEPYLTISNNSIYSSDSTGDTDTIEVDFSDYNNITNNLIVSENTGIYFMYDATNNLVKNNNITAGSAAYTDDYAIHMYMTASNNTFINNTITATNGYGIYARSNYTNITGNTITTTGYSLIFRDSTTNNVVKDTIISSTGSDEIYMYSNTGTQNLTNVTFDTVNWGTSTGKLNILWYLDANVTDTSSNALTSANVTARDKNSNQAFTTLTNATGWIARQEVLSEWRNRTQNYTYSNYTVNATKTGYASNQTNVNLSTSRQVGLTLSGLPLSINISVNPSTANSSQNINVFGHLNDTNGAVASYPINFYLNNTQYTYNSGSGKLEAGTGYTQPTTDSSGNYNYTFVAPTNAGNYTVKVNTTNVDYSAQANATLTVNTYYLNITINLNPNPTTTSATVTVYGHLNDSAGNNITNNTINIYINNTQYFNNTNTGILVSDTTAWWNTSYAYRTKINITSTVSTTLNNTIVLVNLSTSNLISQSKMRSDCGDTRLTDNSGNEIQYTLETSTCNTTNTIYWAWMNLTGNANNTIYAYYGYSAATTKTDYNNPDTGLILYYHFDNNSAYGENSTKVFDFSKKGYNGTCTNCPTWNSTGKYAGAYQFDGINNYINASQIFSGSIDTTNLTYTAWIKIYSFLQWGAIVNQGSYNYEITTETSNRLSLWNWDSSILTYNSMQTNTWYYVIAVKNGTNHRFIIFNLTDVIYDSTTTDSNAGINWGARVESPFNPYAIHIGTAAWNGGTCYFNGSIDEVRLYNRSLSADEILAMYNSTRNYYISNQTLSQTDSNGNYNYTLTAPSTAGNYTIKTNTTYNGMSAEATATLTVNSNPINITLNLNPNPATINQNVSFYGHLNDSTGNNITNNPINIYINNSMHYLNNNTGVLENTTAWWNTSYAYRTKINITSQVSTNLNNTITLVNLSTSDLISQNKMRTDCGDTRFTDTNGNELQYTAETSTCNTNNTIYWVWNNLTGNANTTIYAYYGNSGATLPTAYTNPDDGLVLYMHFDNSSAYGENSNKAYDFSGHGNNATALGDPELKTTDSKYGGYYYFDGNDDFISTNDSSIMPTSAITVMTWIKAPTNQTQPSWTELVGKRLGDSWMSYGFSNLGYVSEEIWFIYDIGASGADDIGSLYGLDVWDNTWHHIAGRYNGTAVSIFVDGRLRNSESESGDINYLPAPTNLSIASWDGAGDFLNGSLDEIRIYNRSLSEDEILAIYNSTRPNYIQNHSLPRTDNDGNYNYTYTPTQAGNYTIKANTTYNSMYAEANATLTLTSILSSCQDLTAANTTYYLAQDVNSTGTCFNIKADNITLDCQGYTINYSQGAVGYGVNISSYNLTTVRNCNIKHANTTNTYSHAIYLSYSNNNTLTNNTMNITSWYSNLVYLTYSDYNTISNSTYYGEFRSGVFVSNSDNNIIRNNTIQLFPTACCNSNPIFIESTSASNTIEQNTLATEEGSGIYFSSCTGSNNNVTNNTISTTEYYNSYGIRIQNSNPITLTDNKINTTACPTLLITDKYNHSIDQTNLAEGLPIIYNHSISDQILYQDQDLSSTYGQLICANCTNVTYHNITIGADGINFFGTNNSIIRNSTFTTSRGYAAWIYKGSNNLITNNTITSTGSEGEGIVIEAGTYNNITQNNINVTVGMGGIVLYRNTDTVSSTLVDNNTINTASGNSIYMRTTSANTISNNIITSTASSGFSMGMGIFLYSNVNTTNITNNIITTTCTNCHGIGFTEASGQSNIIRGTVINTTGNTAYGIYTAGNNSVYDTIITTNTSATTAADIYITEAAILNLTNVSFNKSDVSFHTITTGKLNVFWYLDANVTDTSSNALESANVTGWDAYTTQAFTNLTNSTGWITRQTLQEYWQNRTNSYYYSNYTVNATKTGYYSNTTQVNLTTNKQISLTLNLNTSLTACGDLNHTNTTYYLAQDVNSSGTCFNILANNVTLDGQGYLVNYSTSGSLGYGVYTNGYNNSIIKNLIITEGALGTDEKHGIYLYYSFNSTVFNNTITTSDDYSDAIRLYYGGGFNNISSNRLTTNTARGVYNYGNYGEIADNNITCGFQYGIYQYGQGTAIRRNNIVSSYVGIWIGGIANLTLTENNVTSNNGPSYAFYYPGDSVLTKFNITIGPDNLAHGKPVNYTYNAQDKAYDGVDFTQFGQVIFAGGNNITFRNSNFSNDDLNIYSVGNLTISQNRFTSNNSYGLWISSIYNANITGNNATTSCSNGCQPYRFYYLNGVVFANNTASTSGWRHYGLYLESVNNGIFSNNTLTTYGSYSYGINLDSNNNLLFNKTTIITNGTGANGLYFSDTNNNITFYGLNISTLQTSDVIYLATPTPNITIIDSILNGSTSTNFSIQGSGTGGTYNLTNVTTPTGSKINISWSASVTATLNYGWWLDAYVNYTNGNPAPSVNISSRDKNGVSMASTTTDSNGATRQQLIEYRRNNTGGTDYAYYSNYTVNATKTGYYSNTTQVNLTTNRIVYLILTSMDTCTAPDSGNWNVSCSDNCSWSTDQYISGNMILNGSGHVTLSANLTFTSADQYIIINSGCTFEVRPGGQIRGNSSWSSATMDRCMNITINNSGSETLNNFPAYINLTYDSDMLEDFKDIRFYNGPCNTKTTQLDYEIENYTASTRAHVWVRIPSLPSTGTVLSVYYDNNTAISSGENPTGVWDSNYVGVWHMTHVNATDSTSNENDCNQTGGLILNASGRIAHTAQFNYSNYLNCGNDSSLNMDEKNLTLEAWMRLEDTTAEYRTIMGKTASGNTYAYRLFTANTNGWGTVRIGNDTTFANAYYELDLKDGQWHHVAGKVIRGGYMNVFVDGNKGSDYPYGADITGTLNNTNPLYIGADIGAINNFYFNGTIDEARVSNIARSASWINMSYLIVNNQSQYVGFSTEVTK